jgi:hypothetical protein
VRKTKTIAGKRAMMAGFRATGPVAPMGPVPQRNRHVDVLGAFGARNGSGTTGQQ